MYKILTSTVDLPYEDWLDYRRMGLGGSDASAVCGISKYKSPIELWLDKTGQLPYQEAGEAAYWGNQLESLVKSEFIKRTGIDIIPVNQILQSETYPFMLANLDGVCEHSDYGTCIFEAKTTNAFNSNEWDDKIPDDYMLQIQHYMSVTGCRGAYIAVLIGGNRFKWHFVERDEELIAMLIQLESEFWDYVQSNVPPPLDGSEASAKFLSERFPDSVPSSQVQLPLEVIDLIRNYDDLSEKINHYTELKQEAENLIKQMLGDNESGILGDKIVTWKSVHQERLDAKTLKAEHPALYKKYTNKTSYRRFSIKQSVM